MKAYVEITLEGGDTGGKILEAGVLLAHNAQRRNRTSQKMQSLSGACQISRLPSEPLTSVTIPLPFQQ